jgi:hypothetical protein
MLMALAQQVFLRCTLNFFMEPTHLSNTALSPLWKTREGVGVLPIESVNSVMTTSIFIFTIVTELTVCNGDLVLVFHALLSCSSGIPHCCRTPLLIKQSW